MVPYEVLEKTIKSFLVEKQRLSNIIGESKGKASVEDCSKYMRMTNAWSKFCNTVEFFLLPEIEQE